MSAVGIGGLIGTMTNLEQKAQSPSQASRTQASNSPRPASVNRHILSLVFCMAAAGLSSAASAKCLSSPAKVGSTGPTALTIIVSDGDAATYEQRGYRASSCGATQVQSYRQQVCAISEHAGKAARARLEEIAGVSPEKLCASAEMAIKESGQSLPAIIPAQKSDSK